MLKHDLKKNGKISEDICLLFDEMCLQKYEEYFGGEMIGCEESGKLDKRNCLFYDRRNERVHAMRSSHLQK